MDNWDDAQYVLALSRAGTIRAAAKILGVNHTTVSRRITMLEKQLSAHLFELTPSGYVLTVSGKIICKAAEEIEDLLLGSLRRVEGADKELTGEVHIHMPDIFDDWVCEQISPFLQQHPKLKVQLSSEIAIANLAKREADIALRFTDSPPLDMIGQKVARLPVAVYANKDFDINVFKSLTDIDLSNSPLSAYPWVRWAPSYSDSSVERWTSKVSNKASVMARVTTYKTLTNLIRNGVGIGCLSPWFAEDDPNLKRITPLVEEAGMDVWVLTHPDLRGVKRIKTLKDLLVGIFEDKHI